MELLYYHVQRVLRIFHLRLNGLQLIYKVVVFVVQVEELLAAHHQHVSSHTALGEAGYGLINIIVEMFNLNHSLLIIFDLIFILSEPRSSVVLFPISHFFQMSQNIFNPRNIGRIAIFQIQFKVIDPVGLDQFVIIVMVFTVPLINITWQTK